MLRPKFARTPNPMPSLPLTMESKSLPVLALASAALLAASTALAAPAMPEDQVAAFTDKYCSGCHNDVDREAGLDLTSLKYTPEDPANFLLWVKIHDRVQAGEMPPKEKKRPEASDVAGFVKTVSTTLIAKEKEAAVSEGRAVRRRLNRSEYENALRDLLSVP